MTCILVAPAHENRPLSTQLGGEGKGEGVVFSRQKVVTPVNPPRRASTGVQTNSNCLKLLDSGACPGPRSGIRRNDDKEGFFDFYESINIDHFTLNIEDGSFGFESMNNEQCQMINPLVATLTSW